jgi:hypothetical protein
VYHWKEHTRNVSERITRLRISSLRFSFMGRNVYVNAILVNVTQLYAGQWHIIIAMSIVCSRSIFKAIHAAWTSRENDGRKMCRERCEHGGDVRRWSHRNPCALHGEPTALWT